jgi:hypothetical protein
MPEVAIRTGNFVMSVLSAAILFKCQRLEYLPEYLVQHLSRCYPLLIRLLLRNSPVLKWSQQEFDHYYTVC